MANTYIAIATVEVGASGASSIDFTSIPTDGTYTDLIVVTSLRFSVVTDWVKLRLNGSATNFSARYVQGNGSAVATGTLTDFIVLGDHSTMTANTFASSQIYFPNYTASTYKSISVETVQENNATSAVANIQASLWSNTAAINSITLVPNSGNFVQYSTATLYGIKNS